MSEIKPIMVNGIPVCQSGCNCDRMAEMEAERDRLREIRQRGCDCSDDDACAFARERDAAIAERDEAIRARDNERKDLYGRLDKARARIAELEAERDRLAAENICDACAGSGEPVSGKPCMCGGTGRMSAAAIYLREQLVSETRRADRITEVVEEWLNRQDYPTHKDLDELRDAIANSKEE